LAELQLLTEESLNAAVRSVGLLYRHNGRSSDIFVNENQSVIQLYTERKPHWLQQTNVIGLYVNFLSFFRSLFLRLLTVK